MGKYVHIPQKDLMCNVTQLEKVEVTNFTQLEDSFIKYVREQVKRSNKSIKVYSSLAPLFYVSPVEIKALLAVLGGGSMLCIALKAYGEFQQESNETQEAKNKQELEYLELLTEFNKVNAENNKLKMETLNHNDKEYKSNNNIISHDEFRKLF